MKPLTTQARLLLALPLLICLIVGFSALSSSQADPETHVIRVTCVDGKHTVDPPHSVIVHQGDAIRWEGKRATLTFDHSELTSTESLRVPGQITVKANAPKGRYPYGIICPGDSEFDVPGEGERPARYEHRLMDHPPIIVNGS